jgi:hypothetical protein
MILAGSLPLMQQNHLKLGQGKYRALRSMDSSLFNKQAWRRMFPFFQADPMQLMAVMTQNFAMTRCGEKNQGSFPAENPGGLLAGGECGQKSGGGQAVAYREQCVLEMAQGL